MNTIYIFLFATLLSFISITVNAQIQTLTLQPGPADGKDVVIRDDFPTTPLSSDIDFTSNAWTVGGTECIIRSLISFDLSSVPASAIIHSATLSLYCNIYSGIYQLQSGDNESYLLRVTENWDENSATWVNQPGTTFQDYVLLPTSISTTQDYPEIDVTIPARDMILNPSENFGWMLQLVTEVLYKSMLFASSDNPYPELRPKLTVKYTICPAPIAHFNYQAAGTQVAFSDSSTSATSWYWSFGDGYYSNIQNPEHIYFQQGKYHACLIVNDSCGSDVFCDSIFLCDSPETHFSYSLNDHLVDFTDLSLQATTWYWSFGDGFYSDLQNPLHYFNEYGSYYVCLTSENGCKQETYCDSIKTNNTSGFANNLPYVINLFPNPAHTHISVLIPKEYTIHPISFEIINQTGIVAKKGIIGSSFKPSLLNIEVSGLPNGLYTFKAVWEKGVTALKFVVQK